MVKLAVEIEIIKADISSQFLTLGGGKKGT